MIGGDRTPRARTAIEVAGVLLSTAIVIGAYWTTNPPFFNPPTTIDPWLYTALWVNFDQIYHAFAAYTYYPSRLPWVIPGYALNSLFDPRTAYFVLHGVFFFGGGIAAYLLVRAHFGRFAALVSYIWVLGSQMYFDAHRWDYWDGAVITFLFLGLFFGLPAGRPARWRLALAGFFLAAAVATNLYAVILVLGMPILYGATRLRRPLREQASRVAMDIVAFGAGVAALLGGCALFARTHGGPTWFLGPQIRAAQTIKGSDYKMPYHVWLPQEPYVLVPIFVLVAGAIALLSLPRSSHAFRAGIGALIYLGAIIALLGGWELAGGYLVEYVYYASPVLPAMTLGVAVIACGAATAASIWGRRLALTACFAAVLVPLVYLYGSDVQTEFGRHAYWRTAILMIIAIAALVVRVVSRSARITALAAIAGLVFASGASAYALDASLQVDEVGASSATSSPNFNLDMKAVRFIRGISAGGGLPAFWYDQTADQGAFIGLQSLFYFGFTELGLSMPKWDSSVGSRYRDRNPQRLVLLCESSGCGGAVDVLRRHGIPARVLVTQYLAAGSQHLWIKVLAGDQPVAG
jgi:hypothetical protein